MAREETLERVEQRVELGRISARVAITPEISVRLVAALLALAVATVHAAAQGGITVLNSPALLGWGFRLVEIGGVLTALVILARPARLAWLGWAAGVLLAPAHSSATSPPVRSGYRATPRTSATGATGSVRSH